MGAPRAALWFALMSSALAPLASGTSDLAVEGPSRADQLEQLGRHTEERVRRKLQKLSQDQLERLFSMLDNDGNGQISSSETVDLMDGKNDDVVLIKDCDGNPHPHTWVGDGLCDDGVNSAHCCFRTGPPNFNCDAYQCDMGDCTVEVPPSPVPEVYTAQWQVYKP